jgi:hypothetical protein
VASSGTKLKAQKIILRKTGYEDSICSQVDKVPRDRNVPGEPTKSSNDQSALKI